MKKAYTKPQAMVFHVSVESDLLTSTGVGGQVNNEYDDGDQSYSRSFNLWDDED